jgi:hypothetical protein
MIIGMLEGGEIRIYKSIDDVLSEWGKYSADLASEVIVLYDDDGVWLKPFFNYVPRAWYRRYKKAEPASLRKDYQDSLGHRLKYKLVSVSLEKASKEEQEYQEPLGYLLRYEATSLARNTFVKTLEELAEIYPYDG